jgi:hypothetical protein
MDALAVLDVWALVDADHIAKANLEVRADDLVQTDLANLDSLVGQNDADCVAALLALQKDCVAAEELQLLHLRWVQRNNGVVVVDGIVNEKAVGALLALQDIQNLVTLSTSTQALPQRTASDLSCLSDISIDCAMVPEVTWPRLQKNDEQIRAAAASSDAAAAYLVPAAVFAEMAMDRSFDDVFVTI